jgi:hypothetical protein
MNPSKGSTVKMGPVFAECNKHVNKYVRKEGKTNISEKKKG